jgi:hypothetical protein
LNRFIVDNLGGLPLKLDDFRFFDTAYRDAFNNTLIGFGTDFIVDGCTVSGGLVSAGYIMLNGELLKVDQHLLQGNGFFQKLTTFDPNGYKAFKDGPSYNTYEVNRGIAIANSGTLSINSPHLVDLILLRNLTGTTKGHIPLIGTNLLPNSLVATNGNNRLTSTGTTFFDNRYSLLTHNHIETDPTLNQTTKNAALTVTSFVGKKYGRIVIISLVVMSSTLFLTTDANVGILSVSPNLQIFFSGSCEDAAEYETGSGDLLGNGLLRVRIGTPNKNFRFNFSFFADS